MSGKAIAGVSRMLELTETDANEKNGERMVDPKKFGIRTESEYFVEIRNSVSYHSR